MHASFQSGPHRDDFTILLNGNPLNTYGSEGQCRLSVLILKMATGELIQKETDNPVIYLQGYPLDFRCHYM